MRPYTDGWREWTDASFMTRGHAPAQPRSAPSPDCEDDGMARRNPLQHGVRAMTMHGAIARFFVGPPALVQGHHRQAAGPRRTQFEVVTVGVDEAEAESRCRDALSRL